MILVDTSVWIDYFRNGDALLAEWLKQERVLVHPFVLGEIALGQWRRREVILAGLREQFWATVADDDEVLGFIDRHGLDGCGIGYIDAHLLASVMLTPGARLCTHDKRLQAVAQRLKLYASAH